MIVYFQSEKARLERKRIADQTKGMGRPKVGGPFTLVDHDGRTVTEKDFMGKYSLVSADCSWGLEGKVAVQRCRLDGWQLLGTAEREMRGKGMGRSFAG